jgi:hypothetical protein
MSTKSSFIKLYVLCARLFLYSRTFPYFQIQPASRKTSTDTVLYLIAYRSYRGNEKMDATRNFNVNNLPFLTLLDDFYQILMRVTTSDNKIL